MAAVPGLGKAETKGKGACVFPSFPGREGLVRPPAVLGSTIPLRIKYPNGPCTYT